MMPGPSVSAALAGQVRVHVVLPPVARDGAIVSFRFPRHIPVSTEDYVVDFRAAFWTELVDQSILITGATGSGKTTLLELSTSRIPTSERVYRHRRHSGKSPSAPPCTPFFFAPARRTLKVRVTSRMGTLVRESLRMKP